MPNRSLLGLALLSLVACDAGSPPAEVVVRDSGGVTIVENPGLTGPDLPVWTVPSEPEVVIGALEGEEAYQLFSAQHALRLEDGRILVANAGTHELRVYDGSGRHLETVGRKGGGPGEYEGMWGLVRLPGDSIGVWDWTAKRLTLYDELVGFGRLITPTASLGFVPRLLGAFDDGSFVVTGGINPGAIFGSGGGLREDSITLLRLSLGDGAVLDTLGPFPGPQQYVHMGEGSFWIRTRPFGRQERVVAAADRIFVGDDRTGEIRVVTPAGSVERIIRTGPAPGRVSEQDVAWYRERMLESVEEEDLAEERRRAEQVPPAETLPAFDDLFADRLGRLWLAHADRRTEVPRPWTVLDPDGRLLARIELPRRMQPVDAGSDYLLAHTRDELDVERVVLYSLNPQQSQ